ncbi:DUF1059 domain-containing protein [Modestobacter lacusdianchii]
MKQFDCADLVPGCGAGFRAATADEIIALGRVHAAVHHGVHGEDYTPEIEAATRSLIRDVAPAAAA